MQTYRRFSQMPVWQMSMEVAVAIFDFTQTLPKKEDFALTSQIRKASLSISSNIAEAFGRSHRGNKLNFYYNARGSLCETKSQIHYAHQVGYLDTQQRQRLDEQLDEAWKQINLIIKGLRLARQ